MRSSSLLCLLALLACPHLTAQSEWWYSSSHLPRTPTAEEAQRLDEVGAGFTATPPPGRARAVAEFERSQGVLIHYPLVIPVELVAALSSRVQVYVIVAPYASQTDAETAFGANGVQMARVEFVDVPTDSPWTRDYGPFYIADAESREVAFVDFTYNLPRYLDNEVPAGFGAHLGVPVYAMDVVHVGGNYMTNGLGHAGSALNLLWDNTESDEAVLQHARDYLGLEHYHITRDPFDPSMGHIDTWAKMLGPQKVILAEPMESDPRHAAYEAAADFFRSETGPDGSAYEVVRVPTPNDEPYTNALLLNGHVYVPLVGDAERDGRALDVYRAAMPGYVVQGYEWAWDLGDALHCRVKQVADTGLLSIEPDLLPRELDFRAALDFRARIIPYSGEPLVEDDLFLIARSGDAAFDTLALAPEGDDWFSATLPIPPEGAELAYYFHAADRSGRVERYPFVGAPGARTLTVLPRALEAQEDGPAPDAAALHAPFPNPASGTVTVAFSAGAAGRATVEVVDVLGRRVALLHDGPTQPGWHSLSWAARSAVPGLYLIRLETAEGVRVQRLTVQ